MQGGVSWFGDSVLSNSRDGIDVTWSSPVSSGESAFRDVEWMMRYSGLDNLWNGNGLLDVDGYLVELGADMGVAWESSSASDESEKSEDGLHFAVCFKYR